MPRLCASLALSVCLLGSSALADPPRAQRKPPQFVIISFDGAHDLAQWRRSRALASRTGASFTYFLSCVFLLPPETRNLYHPRRMKAGRSNVGFAMSKQEVEQRLYQIRLAVAEGNELASHGCGHFDGGKWSAEDWKSEFSSFKTILRDAYTLNGIKPMPADWPEIANSVTGFRAPYLSAGKALHQALGETGFAYDASGVSRGPVPMQDMSGLAHFALPQIPEGPKGRRVIAMDYNLYVRHSGGKEDPTRSAEFQHRSYDAFRAAFDKQYNGERIPLQLGFHFTLMNDAAYWRALEQFAEAVCTKPDVACVSYRDYLARTGRSIGRHVGG